MNESIMDDWTGGRGALVGGASGMLAARPANQRPARPDGWRKTRRKEEEIMLMDPGRRLVLSRNATGHAQCAARAEGRSLPRRSLAARSPGCQVSARDLHPGAGWSITTVAAAGSAPSFLFYFLFVGEIISDWPLAPTVARRPPKEGARGRPKSLSRVKPSASPL